MKAMSPFDVDVDVVGRPYVGTEFGVTSGRLRAYAAATNDDTPAAVAGDLAPPVFSFVPLRPAYRAMLTDTTPLYKQNRGMHGEQDIFFFSPIEAGMVLTAHGSVIGIRKRRTGTAVVLNAQTRDQEGVLVNEHFITIYFPGAEVDEHAGVDAPDHRLPDEVTSRKPDLRVVQETDFDQPVRYSAASGDTGAYHLDEQAARDIGLPGIIMHGMCTLAFAGHAILDAVAGGDVRRLRRLAVRFSHPVIPGELLETRLWRLDGDRPAAFGLEMHNPSGVAVGFEMHNPLGVAVLTHGRAEIR